MKINYCDRDGMCRADALDVKTCMFYQSKFTGRNDKKVNCKFEKRAGRRGYDCTNEKALEQPEKLVTNETR